jgi:5'-nucleotidase
MILSSSSLIITFHTIFPVGSLIFNDEVESVRAEVEKLTGQGVNKIIAVGHAGFKVDKQIAEIPNIDIVVGGHSNTFLYSGNITMSMSL